MEFKSKLRGEAFSDFFFPRLPGIVSTGLCMNFLGVLWLLGIGLEKKSMEHHKGQMWEDVKWQPNPCIVRAWGVVFLNVSGSGKAETKKIQSDLEVPISYNSKPG